MAFTPRQIEVLTKYRILLPDGSRRVCDLKREDGPGPLGPGPLLGDDALQALLAADTTPEQEWLDWVFFQAGGGPEAIDQREKALEEIKEVFFNERLNGFTHPKTRQYVPPRPREEVEARWEKVRPTFEDMLEVCDQDGVIKLRNTFGYYRSMPGREGVYREVINALTAYLAVAGKAEELASGYATHPESSPSWKTLKARAQNVVRHFAAKDIRTAPGKQHDQLVYSDDVLDVIVPLTYAASAKYGFHGWDFSDPEKFDRAVAGHRPHHEWKTTIQNRQFLAFIYFKVPVPGWVENGKQYWLTNLALYLPQSDLAKAELQPDSWGVQTEEGKLTLGAVKEMILSEPTRQPPADEHPVQVGAPTIKTPEQAQDIVRHIDTAVAALVEWSKDFDWSQFVPDLDRLPPG